MKHIRAVWLLIFIMPFAAAQNFDAPAVANDPVALSQAMPGLADAAIAVFRDDDHAKYLDNLFRLQIVAGRYAGAVRSLEELQALRSTSESPQERANDLQYLAYARAMLAEDFDAAFHTNFRQVYGALDDRAAALAMRAVAIGPEALRPLLDDVLRRQDGHATLTLEEVLELTRVYQADSAFRRFASLTASLVAEDDERR